MAPGGAAGAGGAAGTCGACRQSAAISKELTETVITSFLKRATGSVDR
jgi:hypothetical protein